MDSNKIKKGLGRGLSSLIGETKVETLKNQLSISDLIPNKYQPRKIFDEDNLNDLTNSIKERGILQPIIVRKSNDDKFKFEIKKAHEMKERLSDVKGIDEIKNEIDDLIKQIKNSSDYLSKGARLCRGVLLSGGPGTGKTLLARAIAGESDVNFIYCTGSNFDEMFVGMGAKRVRELFVEARKNTPCIIFIDEIDSLMSASRRYGSEHSSSRGTIN